MGPDSGVNLYQFIISKQMTECHSTVHFERSYGDGHIERLRIFNRGKALINFWREMQAKRAADICRMFLKVNYCQIRMLVSSF